MVYTANNKNRKGDNQVYDYSVLLGKIKEKYRTQAAFAAALGISGVTLNQKLNNKSEWTQDEMFKGLVLLGSGLGQVEEYFFTQKV